MSKLFAALAFAVPLLVAGCVDDDGLSNETPAFLPDRDASETCNGGGAASLTASSLIDQPGEDRAVARMSDDEALTADPCDEIDVADPEEDTRPVE